MIIYREFYEFNEKLLLNLNYSRYKLSEVMNDFPNVKKIYCGELSLDDKDEEFIKSYFSCIGSTDARSQLEYLGDMKGELLKLKNESELNYKKYGSMYVKLSLAAGILIAVLLV